MNKKTKEQRQPDPVGVERLIKMLEAKKILTCKMRAKGNIFDFLDLEKGSLEIHSQDASVNGVFLISI
jgi:hypothetical protein